MNLNIFRNDKDNVGDANCSPTFYFDIPNTKIIDIYDKNIFDMVNKSNNIIFGGGGLLAFEEKIKQILKIRNKKFITWGLGHNKHDINKIKKSKIFEIFKLNGIRDFGLDIDYVPCPSCMHNSFNVKREIKYPIVVYEHKHVKIDINKFPKRNNSGNDIESVLDFLGSAETIITNSYHGAYWSILLKRKVLMIPFSSKFYGFKYKIPIVNVINWKESINKTQIYNEALEESCFLNKKYYKKVLNVLN